MKPRRAVLLALAFAPLVALIAWQAARTYWLCDDAYISFRYVRNFIEGRGLVFNPGERVEGYTNFLWVLELAAMWKALGVRPETACSVLSSLYTAGSVVLTVVLAASGPFRDRRAFVAWGALLLLGASHTFAVWATSGLETRQFTFLILLAIACLRSKTAGRARLVLASLALAAGEYTRPEANMLFLCCLAWLVADLWRSGRLRLGDLAAFVAPFAVLVGLHFLWRWNYYGDVWPNTYYAKYVRPWPEAGLEYLIAATVEFGLYALVPAALVGVVARLRNGDWTHLLALGCILPHVAYVVWIGGDHFEFRVMDFYWPLLAVAAVEGTVLLARGLDRRLRRSELVASSALVLALLLVTSGVQTAKEIASSGLRTRAETHRLKISISRERFPVLYGIPGLPLLLEAYNAANAELVPKGIAAPHVEHRTFWLQLLDQYAPYESLHGSGCIPEDAVTWADSIGVFGYYLADLVVIDNHGLTDRYVAHLPVATDKRRYMAHERSAPWPYLESRGFNLIVHPAAGSTEEALDLADYALRVDGGRWMPFDSLATAWADKAFLGCSAVRTWSIVRKLGCFVEADLAGWTVEGEAFADGPRPDRSRRLRVHPYRGCAGGGILDSRGANAEASLTGSARSPAFQVPPEASLQFVLGGKGVNVGVRLREGEAVLAEWRPTDQNGVTPERHTLRAFSGKEVELVLFDDSGAEGGFVLLGEVLVLVPTVLGGS